MKRYISKRLLFAIPTMLGVFIVVFFVIRLIPGDPAVVMLGPNATNAQIEAYRIRNGLDKSILIQFGISFKNFVQGDLGQSLSWYRPVTEMVFNRLPGTAELAVIGILFGIVLAIILGIIAAVFRGSWVDLIINAFTTLGVSLPTFYIGLLVLRVFATQLGIIPVISSAPGIKYWQSLFGPVLTMAIGQTAVFTRTTRSSMLEILGEDFVRTARAKGLKERIVLFKHALGNALIPIVTIVGYNLASAFGGAIVLETVFARNGIGKLLIDAIYVRDYPLIQGTTIIIAMVMILINIITDISYGVIDPRIRVSGDADWH